MKLDRAGGQIDFAAIGFCTRALVESAAHRGFRVLSIDAFADFDCARAAHKAIAIQNWGAPAAVDSMLDALRQAAFPPVLFAGGTENWPQMCQAVCRLCPVLGPTSEQLSVLRDPDFWEAAALRAGMGFPQRLAWGSPPADVGPWLIKRFKGAGGLHVRRIATGLDNASLQCPSASVHSEPLADSPPADGGLGNTHEPAAHPSLHSLCHPIGDQHLGKPLRDSNYSGQNSQSLPRHGASTREIEYLQRFVAGRILGAHCALAEDGCSLLGITEAFSCHDWPGPSEFIYRGSWGPVPLGEPDMERIVELGNSVHSATGLCGWMQFDMIQDPLGCLWLLEMNPRWAAGMEILSFSLANDPLAAHLNVFASGRRILERVANPSLGQPNFGPQPYLAAKAILYADRDMRLEPGSLHRLQQRADLTDIPAASVSGGVLHRGQPVLGMRARIPAHTRQPREELLARLLRQREHVLSTLSTPP